MKFYCLHMYVHMNCYIGTLDYYPGRHYVTFPAGEITASFSIVITDDNVVERNERFSLYIYDNSLPNSVVRDSPYSVTLFIEDDDKSRLLSWLIKLSMA